MTNIREQRLAPASYRFGKALPWLLAGFGTIGVMIWLMSLEGTLASNWYYFLLPLIPAAIGVSKLVREMPMSTSVEPAPPEPVQQAKDEPDPLFDAKWWVRYPISLIFFAGSYYCAFELERRLGWLFALLLLLGGLGLIRELFVALLLAALAGGLLWAAGAAVAALPVSAAIIIGAMIIAQSLRR
jgi:hypothetical protein